jgi:hypothetical protein
MKEIEEIASEIRLHHMKIIDDWCKAYLADCYRVDGVIPRPGEFMLYEQHMGANNNHIEKKYYFKKYMNSWNYPEDPEYFRHKFEEILMKQTLEDWGSIENQPHFLKIQIKQKMNDFLNKLIDCLKNPEGKS